MLGQNIKKENRIEGDGGEGSLLILRVARLALTFLLLQDRCPES